MSVSAKRTSKKYLQKMGVNIITETFVKDMMEIFLSLAMEI
jgi:hypothetical protein